MAEGCALLSDLAKRGMFLWFDVARLDMMGELALAVDRVADQRAAFIRQRWQAGPFQGCSSTSPGASLAPSGGQCHSRPFLRCRTD
jgi:hypothetical protein